MDIRQLMKELEMKKSKLNELKEEARRREALLNKNRCSAVLACGGGCGDE